MSKTEQVLKPVLIALAIVGAFSLTACINSTFTIEQAKQRDTVCALQDYNPMTAQQDIQLCRLKK
ncbi:hypothetical protein [Enterobacter hormaechei]